MSHPKFLHTWLLFWRNIRTIIRDPVLSVTRLIGHVAIGLLLVVMFGDKVGKPAGCPPVVNPMMNLETFPEFRQDLADDTLLLFANCGSVFFTAVFILFAAMMPTVMTFPLDMQVFKKEKLNGWYGPGPYYIAKTLADLPFQVK